MVDDNATDAFVYICDGKRFRAMSAAAAAEVFIYTGVSEGAVVPSDVVRVRIDPSVLAIPIEAFKSKYKLQEVEFHEGLREIGEGAFFFCTALNDIHLSDGIESIGDSAFHCCNFAKFRSPPLVTTIHADMFNGCNNIFSLEFTESIIQIEDQAFGCCYSLRNIALAMNTFVEETAFNYCTDLLQIFDTVEAIVNALKIRFAGLPIHGKMYYKSYYNPPMTLEDIRNTIIIDENGERDPTGLQQDCLGMTPLHILACSTVQCIELYQLMVGMYSGNLIVEDAWGALPLLYAVWGDAPSEIVQFLVNSYQSHYPNHEFDWNTMVITLGRANAPTTGIQNLLDIQQTLSPMYNIDWDRILGLLAIRPASRPELTQCASSATLCFLTRCSIATRVNAIGVKHFRDAMADDWMGCDSDYFNGQVWRAETLTKLEYYESECSRLQESTSLLELALWKARIDESKDHVNFMVGGNKKMKMDQSEFRLQCRISCGADYVIENVFPYLLPPDFVRSYVDEEEDNDEVDDDDDNDFIENIDDEEENEEH